VPDPSTGEIADSCTTVIGEANAVMRVHDRMPAILGTEAAHRWLEPGPLQAELLVPYPAEEMQAWRVSDGAKSSRIEPHARMAEANGKMVVAEIHALPQTRARRDSEAEQPNPGQRAAGSALSRDRAPARPHL